jgi:hypothetical protein
LPGWEGLVYGKAIPFEREGVKEGKDGILFGDTRLTYSEEEWKEK